jgi:hypothetical protein
MSKPIDYEFRFWIILGMMFIMLGLFFMYIGQHNVFWSIWCISFAAWDGLWAKISYDNWKFSRK